MSGEFQRVMKANHIHHYTTQNVETKAAIAERVIRTLKGRIYRFMTAKNTLHYLDDLQQLVLGYNRSKHRSIKMAPLQVTASNQGTVLENLFPRRRRRRRQDEEDEEEEEAGEAEEAEEEEEEEEQEEDGKEGHVDDVEMVQDPCFKYHKGDKVRVAKARGTFSKGYHQSFTMEIFTVDQPIAKDTVPVYRLVDYYGEPVQGDFYEQELQLVTEPEFYAIDEVLQRRQRRKDGVWYLVQWKGHPAPSWVREEDIKSL